MDYPDLDNLNTLKHLAGHAEYAPICDKAGAVIQTHCNFFVRDVSLGMGCEDLQGMTANEMTAYLEKHPEDWSPLRQDWRLAQYWANGGHLVIYARADKPHGHVCVGVPGTRQWSPKNNAQLPVVANVGSTCFVGKHLGWAFSPEKLKTVHAFAWKGPASPAQVA